MVHDRDLKFRVCIPHEKIVDPYFFSCPSYAPFLSYFPLKTKFENLVCKISRKVFKLEPSYLVYWLGLRGVSRRTPGSPGFNVIFSSMVFPPVFLRKNYEKQVILTEKRCLASTLHISWLRPWSDD